MPNSPSAPAAARPGSALLSTLAVIASFGAFAAVGVALRPATTQPGALPASATDATARLTASTRHGEWVTVTQGADTVRAWVVYPERKGKAPVVVVIHEIFGLTNWIRAVADQAAADGFIAIAPDLMTGKISQATPDSAPQLATATIRTLKPEDVQRQISLVADYAMKLPAAQKKYGVVGFCWGGSTVYNHAVAAPALGASVVYYGTSPASTALSTIKAPVLGLYGENDARVNATIPGADSTMKALKKSYETRVFTGAGHGFLRQQDGQNGANLAATKDAWPMTIAFFRKHLGS